MSHLVYITLYGETDDVILSRLDCNRRLETHPSKKITYLTGWRTLEDKSASKLVTIESCGNQFGQDSPLSWWYGIWKCPR